MIVEIFGEKCKRAKVFDLLLSHPYTEYTKTDIATITGIARGTLDTFIDEILGYGIIKHTRQIGNGQLYQINMESIITRALNSFQNQLADIEIEKEMERYRKDINPEIKPIRPFEEIIKIENIKTGTTSDIDFDYSNLIKKITKSIQLIIEKTPEYEPTIYNLYETSSKTNPNLINRSTNQTETIKIL